MKSRVAEGSPRVRVRIRVRALKRKDFPTMYFKIQYWTIPRGHGKFSFPVMELRQQPAPLPVNFSLFLRYNILVPI